VNQEFDWSKHAPKGPQWQTEQQTEHEQPFPAPESYCDFEASQIPKPRIIVDGLLDSGSRMVVGGGSKTYKTWAMSDMALSIACGAPWWKSKCYVTAVLYVNFELKRYYARERLMAIRRAKSIPRCPDNLWIWNLRNFNVAKNLSAFRDATTNFLITHSIGVVFLDPFYKLIGDADERISSELIPVLEMFESISHQTECSSVTGAHFTKGNQAAKEAIDRISGGGVINRHPDSLLMLTKHEQDDSFVVDTIVRDFEPIKPFVVSWHYPLLISNCDLDPAKLKKPGVGKKFTAQDLLDFIAAHDDEFSNAQLLEAFRHDCGCSRATFFELKKILLSQKVIFLSPTTSKWNLAPKVQN